MADDHYRLPDDLRQGQHILDLAGHRVGAGGRQIQAVLAAHDAHDPEAPGKPRCHLPPRGPVVIARMNNQNDRAPALVQGAHLGAVR
jgi:hypothetical protein